MKVLPGLISLLMLDGGISMFAPRDHSQTAASVSGVVIDARTRLPVPDARVLLAPLEAPLTQSLIGSTDVEGRFQIGNVPPGPYRLFANHADYLRGEHTAPVTLTAAQRIDDLSIALTATAVISGRVTTEAGEPAPKVYVRAHTDKPVAESRTNDLGEYRLFGLRPGTYVISAERYRLPRIEDTRLGIQYVVPTPPCPDCRGEGQFMQQLPRLFSTGAFIDPLVVAGQSSPAVYYPGTTDRAAAQAVEAGPGARLAGIDLRLVVK
jgi:hypothetical protein